MLSKIIIILSLLITLSVESKAQLGNSSPGNIDLANTSIGKSNAFGQSTLPNCTPMNYACNTPASSTYVFTGNGDWRVPENWLNNLIPPSSLMPDFEIIIDPEGTGEAVLNVRETILSGAKLTVLAGKRLRVTGNVNIQQ